MSSAISGFFGGGGSAASLKEIGHSVEGPIVNVSQPEQQRDYETGLPKEGKYQIRIELQTDTRDPEKDGDDGRRTVYVRGWMTGAIGDALRKAGAKEPEVGGWLKVTYVSDAAPSRPGLRGAKQYQAEYKKPSGNAGFFNGGGGLGAAVSTDAVIPSTPPPGIDPAAWASMPDEAKQAIANSQPPF